MDLARIHHGDHVIQGCRNQLNLCVFFDKCFLHTGLVDKNASYIFIGVRDGFKIVDEDFVAF